MKVAFVIESEPDRMGRQRFSMYWFRDRKRAQCFFAVLAEYLDKYPGAMTTTDEREAERFAWGDER